MSGVPLPVNDVAPGTVTVRVIRGSLANVVPGQDVELQVGGASRTVKTNDAGRAEFNGLAPGTRVKAMTVVDGERLESQEFDVPATGGIRLMLVAAAPAASAPPRRERPRLLRGLRRMCRRVRAACPSADRRASCSRWATKRSRVSTSCRS